MQMPYAHSSICFCILRDAHDETTTVGLKLRNNCTTKQRDFRDVPGGSVRPYAFGLSGGSSSGQQPSRTKPVFLNHCAAAMQRNSAAELFCSGIQRMIPTHGRCATTSPRAKLNSRTMIEDERATDCPWDICGPSQAAS